VVDPIDGTVAYMKGKPWWCIPIAVVEDGRPIAAVIHAPALGETFTATLGGGAALQGRPITASDTTDLDDASVLADARLMEGPHWIEPWPAMRFEKRNAIAYRMALVAAGAFDAAINLTPKLGLGRLRRRPDSSRRRAAASPTITAGPGCSIRPIRARAASSAAPRRFTR